MSIGADVVTGLLSSIVYDGLKRPFKGMADALGRRRAIHRALTERLESDTGEASKAIADLAKVIANAEGLYTERTAQFLATVDRSAIPDAIKQFVMCGRSYEDSFPAFDLIYRSCAPLPFNSRALFSALGQAIEQRIKRGTNDPALYENMRAQNADVSKRIEALANSLANAKGISAPLLHSEYEDSKIKLARLIEVGNKYLNVETTNGTKKVHINRLVISSRVCRVSGALPVPHRDGESDDRESISYMNFRRSFDRAVILGDPGGGKSTLTQLLCYSFANQISLEAANPLNKSFDSRDLRLPLRVVLRSLDRRQQKSPSYTIFDYIVDEYKQALDNDTELTKRFIRQALTLGNAVILLDGLDEILEIESRRNMTTYIEQFVDTYASCPSLVTSRIVGYKDAPLADDYSLYTLSRFNAEEVRKYSAQLMKAVGSLTAAQAAISADTFLSQTEHSAADLRENPLLLGLMVYIYMQRGDVPNNRPEIYKECSLLMFEKWDQRRDIIFSFPQDFDLLDLFGFLAREIFGNAETEDGVDEEWLKVKIRTFFDHWYEDRAKSVEASKLLVKFITGRAWVMCEVGPGVFKFTHRTFLEYFFARRLEEESGSVSNLITATLYDKVVKSEWDVVSHLALQIATFRSGPKSQQAGDVILEIVKSVTLSPAEELNLILFVSRALEYLNLPEGKLREFTNVLFSKIVLLGSTYSADARELCYELLRSTNRRGAVVKLELESIISPILAGPSSSARTFCLYLVSTRVAGFRFARANASPVANGILWSTFAKVRVGSKGDQYKRALDNMDEARAYIFAFADKHLDLYRKHGFGILTAPPSALIPLDVPLLPYGIIADSIKSILPMYNRYFGSDVPSDVARMILGEMVDDIVTGRVKNFNNPNQGNLYGIVEDSLSTFISSISHRKITKPKAAILAEALLAYLFFLEINLRAKTATDPHTRRMIEKFSKREPGEPIPLVVEKLRQAPLYPVLRGWVDGSVTLATGI